MKLIHKLNENYEHMDIFATEEFLKSRSNDYGWFVTEKFMLPFIIDKKLFFRRMIFTTECLPLVENLSVADEKLFLDQTIQKCKEENLCDFIYKAQANAVFGICPDDSVCMEWGSYIIDLTPSIEDIFQNIHAKHRNRIRHAMNNDVTVHVTEDMLKVYDLIKFTFERQKKILFPSLEYIQKLKNNLKENMTCFEALKDGELQGVAVVIYDDQKAYCIFAGSTKEPFSGSIALMHYEMMKYCKECNMTTYDFMGARIHVEKGSKFDGLQRFKKRFGADLKQGYAFQVILKPIKFKLFNFLVKTYFKLKGSSFEDIINQGIKVSK